MVGATQTPTPTASTIRRTIDEAEDATGNLDYDGAAFYDYLDDYPHRVWDKVRRRDAPAGYKAGIDVQWPGT